MTNIGFIMAIFALGAGNPYSFYMPSFGPVVAHKDMIRHLINMGIICTVEIPARVAITVVKSFVVRPITHIKRYMSKERQNRVGIHNVNVAKLCVLL